MPHFLIPSQPPASLPRSWQQHPQYLWLSISSPFHSARGIFLEQKSNPSPCLQPSSGFQLVALRTKSALSLSLSDPMITVRLAPAGPSQTQLLLPVVKCHPHCSSKSALAKISASTGPVILLKNIEESIELWIVSTGILRFEIKTEILFKYLSGFLADSWNLVSAPAFCACIMWPLENSSVYS